VIPLDGFWGFISYRPGLSATEAEWTACLGVDGWRSLRKQILVGDGVSPTCVRPTDGRTLRIVPMSGGTYGLVCPATGNLEASGLPEADVTGYRLDANSLRAMVANALGITPDPQPVREVPRAFPVGNWEPATGAGIPAFMILPPTTSLLTNEINRLLLEHSRGFVLLVPRPPKLSATLRAHIERQQACIIPLCEVVACDALGRFSASSAWQTYRDAYCQRHLADRMVPALPAYQFARKSMWAIRFAGTETFLEGDLKGAAFIHHLIRHQGQRIHVVRLMADVAGAERAKVIAAAEGLATDSATADDAADERTIKECQARYDALVAEREHADEGRLSKIETEIAEIAAYLSSTLGLGKKSRKLGDEVAAARRRIARVVNIAYDKIEKSDPELAIHLRNSIRTHTEMVYEPDREVDWVLT